MILSPNDPLLANLGMNYAELESAIALAQGIAEGPQGANQPLEKRTVLSVVRLVNGVGFLPVLPIHLADGVSVEYRVQDLLGRSHFQTTNTFSYGLGAAQTGWQRHSSQGVARWETLAPESYVLDFGSGEIVVHFVAGIATPLSQVPSAEIKATYTGGYDFSLTSDDPLVMAMKASMVEIIRANRATASGMTKFDLDDFYSVSIDNKAVAANYGNALSIFQRLRSRV